MCLYIPSKETTFQFVLTNISSCWVRGTYLGGTSFLELEQLLYWRLTTAAFCSCLTSDTSIDRPGVEGLLTSADKIVLILLLLRLETTQGKLTSTTTGELQYVESPASMFPPRRVFQAKSSRWNSTSGGC